MTEHILMKEKLTVKNNLEIIRKKLGLSQGDVANRAGITPDTYFRIEKGITCPNLKTAFAIAKAINTRIDKIFYIRVYER